MRFRGWGWRAIAFGAVASGVAACTNESPSLRIIPVIPPDNATISFKDHVQLIFDRSCISCHNSLNADNVRGLILEEGQARGNLVGVPSTEATNPPLLLVNPGHSDQSYLIHKLEGTGLGDRMPARSDPLPDVEIQLIKDWIDQGALDN